MAAPPLPDNITIHDITGEWTVDKARTKGVEENMAIQGISWLLRKTYGLAKVTLKTTMTDEKDIEVLFTGTGFPMTLSESMVLDWTPRTQSLAVIGKTEGRSRIVTFAADAPVALARFDMNGDAPQETDEDLAWLAEGWLAEEEGGGTALIEVQNRSVEAGGTYWAGHGTWGFMLVDGVRTHVRKTVVWNSKKSSQSFMVYHYLGPVQN